MSSNARDHLPSADFQPEAEPTDILADRLELADFPKTAAENFCPYPTEPGESSGTFPGQSSSEFMQMKELRHCSRRLSALPPDSQTLRGWQVPACRADHRSSQHRDGPIRLGAGSLPALHLT